MHDTALLIALSESRLFAVDLDGVALSRCTITIITAVAGEEPTVDQEKAGVPLKLGNTVGVLAKDCPRLFIRVRLPQEHDQGMYIREAHGCTSPRMHTTCWSVGSRFSTHQLACALAWMPAALPV
jgi:hypothetical protein